MNKFKCSMGGGYSGYPRCRRMSKTLLNMGTSARIGNISLVICDETHHAEELAHFWRMYIRREGDTRMSPKEMV